MQKVIKKQYSDILQRALSNPTELSVFESYRLCKELVGFGYIDLASIACFQIQPNGMPINLQLLLTRNQVTVETLNMNYASAKGYAKLALEKLKVLEYSIKNQNALEKLENQPKKTKEEKMLNALETIMAQVLINDLRLSFYLKEDINNLQNTDEKIRRLIDKIGDDSCLRALYWDTALTVFPYHLAEFLKELELLERDKSCYGTYVALANSYQIENRISGNESIDVSRVKNLKSLLNESIEIGTLEVSITLLINLYYEYFSFDKEITGSYLEAIEKLTEIHGSVGGKASFRWLKAIQYAIDNKLTESKKMFDTVCILTTGKKYLVKDKMIFGGFSHLDERDLLVVNSVYQQSICKPDD